MHWINKVREPKRLVLAWQQSDLGKTADRKRRAVAEIVRSETDGVRFTYLVGTPGYEEAKALGFHGYPAFKLGTKDHTQGVLEAFVRRLPPRHRPDFRTYLDALRIGHGVSFSDFALLAISEAKLPSDGFSIVDPLDDFEGPAEMIMEIAGYRHNEPSLQPQDVGREVEFVEEPGNPHDPEAVMIMMAGRKLGYVNTIQAPKFKRILAHYSVKAIVERLNGKPDRPRAFVFVEVQSR